MSISYVGAGTSASGTGASITPALPASCADGDLLLVVVTSYSGTTHGSSTSGWTKITETSSGTNRTSYWWARYKATSPGANETSTAVTVTQTSGPRISARCVAYRGVIATGTPYVLGTVNTTTNTAAAAMAAATAALTTSGDGSLVLHIVTATNSAGSVTFSSPTGVTGTTMSLGGQSTGGSGQYVAYYIRDSGIVVPSGTSVGPANVTISRAGTDRGVLLEILAGPSLVTSVTSSPETANVLPSGTVSITATALPSYAANRTVNWSVLEGESAGTVSPTSTAGDGLDSVTFTASASEGVCHVVATAADGSGFSDTTTINVATLQRTIGPSFAQTGTGQSVTVSGINASAGDLIVVGIAAANGTGATCSWSGSQQATDFQTIITHANSTAGHGIASVCAAIATGSISGASIVVDAGVGYSYPAGQVIIYSGGQTSGSVAEAFGAVSDGQGTTAASLSPSVTATGSSLLAVFEDWNVKGACTPLAADSAIYNVADTSSGGGTQSVYVLEQTLRTDSTGPTTIGCSAPSSGLLWNGAAVEILKSSGSTGGSASLDLPAASGSSGASAPGLQAQAGLPAASATASAAAPGRAASLSLPAAAGTLSAPAPALAVTAGLPAAAGTLAATAPALQASLGVPAAAGTPAANAPAGAAVAGLPAATPTLAAAAPGLAAAVGLPASSSTASAVAPGLSAVLGVPAASGTFTAYAPGLTASAALDLPAASVTLAAAAPGLQASVPLPAATGALAASAPALAASIGVPAASGALATFAPGLGIGLPAATGTFAAFAPGLAARLALPAAASTAGAVAPGLAAAVGVPAVSASSSAAAPGFAAVLALPAATLALAASAPGLAASLGVPSALGSTSASFLGAAAQLGVPVAVGIFTANAPGLSKQTKITPHGGTLRVGGTLRWGTLRAA